MPIEREAHRIEIEMERCYARRPLASKELQVILRRLTLILIALTLMPATSQARLQAQDGSSEAPPQKKVLRILVEGDASAIPMAIEEMRRNSRGSGFKIIFVSKSTDPYDARIVLTFGTGKTWDPSPNIPPGEIRFPVQFAFGTAVVLASDGEAIFTVAQSGNTAQSAGVAVAREIVRTLGAYSTALSVKQNHPELAEPHSQKPAVTPQAISSTGSSIPAEPGIYYKAPDGWVRLEQVSPKAVEPRGVGTALLTGGISGVRMIQEYRGAKSNLEIREQQPRFFVRGFALSEEGVQIVRLEKKKDHREIVAGSITPFNAKAGYGVRDTTDVVVSRISGDVVAITPGTQLKPGEYLLSFARLELRYDFGTTEKK